MKIPLINVHSTSEIKPVRITREGFTFGLLTMFILLCLLISPAAAATVDWKITPASPMVGDTLKITGTASRGADVAFSVSHDMKLPVTKGRYRLELNNLPVPEWNNNLFTVRAEGVKNLKISDDVTILGDTLFIAPRREGQ